MTPRRAVPPLVASVKKQIADTPGAAKSWRADLALRLAAQVEDEGEPLAARVSAGRLLTETLAALDAVRPAEQPRDGLDEIRARRESRKAS